MDCVLKIVGGPEPGREVTFAAAEGMQAIMGRSGRCEVQLSDAEVSFEHAVIGRERGDFYLENLSANGTWVNGEKISGRARLRTKDQIRIGQTVLRVEKLPAAAKARGARPWVVVLFVGMMAALLAVVIWDPLSEGAGGDAAPAYAALQRFVQEQVHQQRLPAEVPGLLADAWRHEVAGDRAEAARAWLRLHVELNETEGTTGIQELSAEHHAALAKLSKGGEAAAGMKEEQMTAALLQFVTQMERRR
jgi:hypothetical protein